MPQIQSFSLFPLLITLCYTLATPALTQANPNLSTPNLAQFRADIKKTLKEHQVPGAAVAVIQNGELVFKETFGVKKRGSTDPINQHTIFKLASLSKGFSGALAAQLQEKGEVDLSKRIKHYKNLAPAVRENLGHVNTKHILSHSAGVTQYFGNNLFGQGKSFEEITSLLDFGDVPYLPGKEYGYQNIIFSLIRPILEFSTNKSFITLMQDELLTPLNMQDTVLTCNSWANTANRTFGHRKIKGNIKSFEACGYYDTILPAGGIASSIHDMSYWLAALLGHKPKVLSDNARQQLFTKHIQTQFEISRNKEPWRLGRLKNAHYGLGWRIYDYAGHNLIFHSGMINGFTNTIAFVPENNTGIVVLTNSVSDVGKIIMANYLDRYLHLPKKDWSQLGLKERRRQGKLAKMKQNRQKARRKKHQNKRNMKNKNRNRKRH